jgi:hypothetical protein
MGLLDGGLSRIMGAAFRAVYLDGELIRQTNVDDGKGTITTTALDPVPIKYQVDVTTEAQRSQPDYRATDVRVIVLDPGVVIDSDCLLSLGGQTYRVAPDIKRDPAQSHYELRGVLR